MSGILDRVACTAAPAKYNLFLPSSPDEFFALQLARRLHEPGMAHHYSDLLKDHSVAKMLTAFHRANSRGSHTDPGRSFHDELERLGNREAHEIRERRLAAIRIERRGVAVAILSGVHLEYPPLIRQLPSDNNKAQMSAASFISSVIGKCPFLTAALETVPGAPEIQRQGLRNVICAFLSQYAVGIWEVAKVDLLAAFGHPPLRNRSQVHHVIESIWPDMNGSSGAPLIRDALALGLYCQTEYLFNL